MDIEKLNEDELLTMRAHINEQLKKINKIRKNEGKQKSKKKLSDLCEKDEIFYICFRGSNIFNMGLTNFILHGKRSDSEYYNYTSTNGVSSCLNQADLNLPYFLDEFTSSMYFFTMRPSKWRPDLETAMNAHIIRMTERHVKIIEMFKSTVADLINNGIEIDKLLNAYKK